MKTHTLSLVLAGIELAFVATPLASQQVLSQLRQGQRIRVVAPESIGRAAQLRTGSLVRVAADTVVFTVGGGFERLDLVTVAVTPGTRIEVLAATRSQYGVGAAIGGLLGALAGGAVGSARASADWHPCESRGFFSCFMYPSQEEAEAAGAIGGLLIGGLAGGLIGALVGSQIRTETWAPVALRPAKTLVPARVVVAPLPTGRVGLGAAISF